MTYAFSLILWMTTAQTAGQPDAVPAAGPVAAPAATPSVAPAAVVVQCPPGGAERTLQDQLDEALRDAAEAKVQVAKLKEEARMPDHALAALLVSDHPDLVPLKRISVEPTSGTGLGRIRRVQAEVYVSQRPNETMAAVVLTIRNPREAPTWEPKEAFYMPPAWRQDPTLPVALRSSPERIRPGETARIALVFNLADLRLDEQIVSLALFRDGQWEMETEVPTARFLAAAAVSGGHQ